MFQLKDLDTLDLDSKLQNHDNVCFCQQYFDKYLKLHFQFELLE